MKNVVIDTGFWFALYDERDEYHHSAVKIMDSLINCRFLLPFPTLYETLNTAFTKNKRLLEFKTHVDKAECELIHDNEYKLQALHDTFESSIFKGRHISLVDMIIRHMLDDVNLHVEGLISFNPGDFDDVCRRHGIELISHYSIG